MLPQRFDERKIIMQIPIMEINEKGNISTIYNDFIDLYDLGLVTNIRRASHILFNQEKQYWEIINAQTNEIVSQNKIRDKCVEWEIENFQCGGKYYNE